MIKTSNTTYAKFSHHLQHTHMDCLKILATDAAVVIRFIENLLKKNCLVSYVQMFSCHL